MNSEMCKKLVKIMSKAYKILKVASNSSKCEQWLKYGKRKIQLLKKYLQIDKNTLAVSLECSITSSLEVLTARNRNINNLQKKVVGINENCFYMPPARNLVFTPQLKVALML